MACIPVTSERAAFRIFETLNDRGLRLSVPDLLLNYLMRIASDDPERSQIREYWNEMLEQMGRRDINKFLRHMWVSKYGDLKKQDLFSALKNHIESEGIHSIEFTQTCSEECESYTHLVDHNETYLGKAASPHFSRGGREGLRRAKIWAEGRNPPRPGSEGLCGAALDRQARLSKSVFFAFPDFRDT